MRPSVRAFLLMTTIVAVAVLLAACEQGGPGLPADDGFRVCSGQGCDCEPGRIMACYPEAPLVDEAGEAYCVEGIRTCGDDGLWGECIFPEGAARYALIGDPELCGGCDPGCFRVHDCPTQLDLDADNSNNVRFDLDADGLVLGGQLFNARYAYIANDPQSTVSKLDLSTGEEVARYRVGLPGLTNSPSRTAIDSRGDAYVANRAFGQQGSVTKMAGDRSNCYDRNRDGDIDTSTGGADIRPYGEDECVLWTVSVGPSNGIPRAVAVDADDRVWVGLYNTRRFDVLDANDGSLIRSVNVSGYPYGAAIGGDGRLWYPNGCCGRSWIQAVDTGTFAVGSTISNTSSCAGSYGIAVDLEGRVLLGGYSNSCVSRYDPPTGAWQSFTAASGMTRGVTIDADGHVWTASHSGSAPHWLTRWNDDGTGRVTYTLRDTAAGRNCSVPIGVGADFEGRIWTPCQSTSNVARLDPDTGQVTIHNAGPNPYTYSDFTGFLRATVTSPEGSYRRRYDSRLTCSADQSTEWSQLYWEVETPAGSQINFWGRTAAVTTDLGMAADMLLGSIPGDIPPADIDRIMTASGVTNGLRYFEVRVQLRSLDGDTSPVFRNMNMVYYCVCSCDVSASCDAGCTCDEDC